METSFVAHALATKWETPPTSPAITAVITDSRQAGPGKLFFALPGATQDGHEFVTAALAAGCAGAVVEKNHPGYPHWAEKLPILPVTNTILALGSLAQAHLAHLRANNQNLTVIGITGSAGKTTTKDLLATILTQAGETVFPPNSFNNEIGLPLTVLRATTKTRYLVLEMGADAPGNLKYLTTIAPLDIAVVLLVGKAHLGSFGTVETLARSKAEILDSLRPGSTAILNADDPAIHAMVTPALVQRLEISAAGIPQKTTKYWATDTHLDSGGKPSFTLHMAADPQTESALAPLKVSLGLIGTHHVANALAAFTAASAAGLPPAQIAASLQGAGAASPHRMDVFTHQNITYIDDAYNANPDSMQAALRALTALAGPTQRRIAVLGDMLELGPTAPELHALVGQVAATEGVDHLVAVGPAARDYLGAEDLPAAQWVPDLEAARALLATLLRPGDVVLFKGSQGSGIWRLASEFKPAQEGE